MRAHRKGGRGRQVERVEFRVRPFAALASLLAAQMEHRPRNEPAKVAGAVPQPVPCSREAASEEELFWKEMADVIPLDPAERNRIEVAGPASSPRPILDEDAEALAELYELAQGSGHFDVTFTDEYVEGICSGLDIRLLRRLRRGEFACQAHLDLHGCTWEEAKTRVDAFLTRAWRDGKRCVLIVHGRGRNSKDQVPVLKSRLSHYLSRSRWSRVLLAFCSARPVDGGGGAMYVLLRRRRGERGPWRVATGVHW